MAQDSRRVRRERRIKRERSQLRQAVGLQQNQLRTVVGLLQQAQAEVRKLKPVPSITIRTLPDHDDTVADDSPFIDPDYTEPVEETHDIAVSSDPS